MELQIKQIVIHKQKCRHIIYLNTIEIYQSEYYGWKQFYKALFLSFHRTFNFILSPKYIFETKTKIIAQQIKRDVRKTISNPFSETFSRL